MKKMIAMTLLGGLLLSGPAHPAPAASPPFMALFCPDCWDYLWGPGAVDMKGNCGVCGKYPVEIEAQPMSWWWCGREKKWRRAPCSQNWMMRCCTGEESLAAVVAPNPKMFEAWYCPAHRSFFVYRLPILSQRVCRTCGRPAVRVDAMGWVWYCCETDGVWAPRPCPMNPVKKCCAKRDGLLLVKPEAGPMAQ